MMQAEFWQHAWKNGNTGFTQSKPNYMLVNYFEVLNTPKQGRVFVPLCGKSPDIIWFAEQGYEVVGIDLVERAVVDFFAERGIEATITPHPTTPNLTCYQAEHNGCDIQLWVGDIFDLTPADIGKVDSIYDRGALVALPDFEPDCLRTRYTQQLIHLSGGANQLLLTFAYDDEYLEDELQRVRPPFIITEAMLDDYYAKHYDINMIVRQKNDVVSTAGNSGYRLAYTLIAKSSQHHASYS
ncbi:class I SAM-dependent methyltransferase [Psychrobacter lutiphocae]|uniref:thiopurine S-methyltransferase n=1 Tax=Psychrobacter lutiphocae TaxID=540500 RepID=UPI0003A55D68|nr:thiopurine S-methyltransferase [Psychrobacter lutiphocae]